MKRNPGCENHASLWGECVYLLWDAGQMGLMDKGTLLAPHPEPVEGSGAGNQSGEIWGCATTRGIF